MTDNWRKRTGYIIYGIVLGFASLAVMWDFKSGITQKQSATHDVFYHTAENIGLVELLKYLTQPGSICVDTRSRDYYELGHIPTSLSVDWSSHSQELNSHVLKKIVAAGNVIIYANKEDESAGKLAANLAQRGIIGIKLYRPGWEEWIACNLPVHKGLKEYNGKK